MSLPLIRVPLGVVDTLIGLPAIDRRAWQAEWAPRLRDAESGGFDHPAGYLFQTVPRAAREVGALLDAMDSHGIEIGLLPVSFDDAYPIEAVRAHPDRFVACLSVDPNRGAAARREMDRAVGEIGAPAVSFMPAGLSPPVPINDRLAYAIYEKAVALDLAVFVNAGVPGPRVPAESQHPMLADEVCWEFPDLRLVFRHGGEPWVDLVVKLLLKWPNLYYSTSAFAPRHYPKAIIEFANTRGAHKILYGGYYPWGLELSRIFSELPGIGLRQHVWPLFLRDNARRVLRLDGDRGPATDR